MLYRLIERKRNEWFNSDACTVKNLLDYMINRGVLRDAQLESIKTYLYLKLACENRPLWQLFFEGKFNSIDIGNERLSQKAHTFLASHPEAAALYEYAIETNDVGVKNAPQLAAFIEDNPEKVDYEGVIKKLLHNVTYVDYLFSIPMGAGKTWLMAIIVYLNLYFATTEPNNPLFAHNFIIVAPAGLKSSILPSITKDLKDFDPSIILPQAVASTLRKIVKLEILNETSSANNSNIVKNPNARKVQSYQPFDTLMGLVMVTNAEKLYDKIEKSENVPYGWEALPQKERDAWLSVNLANELRTIIGKIPNLCVMVDEMHHASSEQNLRKVIEKWVAEPSFNSLLGFSGTPYFPASKTIKVSDDLKIRYNMLGNVVTYYPLVNAVQNFLKFPIIKYSDVSNLDIVRSGVRDFLAKYKDTNYEKVGCAKLAIYCGYIATLENEIYPEVCSICNEFNLSPEDVILRYYGNNNDEGFKCPPTAEADFQALDSPYSKYKIILLVQIGKEGWNCKSLTSVILPNPNSSTRNDVLQKSCRCLREVNNASKEKALIWLSKLNHEILDDELKKKHHTSISELSSNQRNTREAKRYSRQNIVKLPALSYIQLHISYKTVRQESPNPQELLKQVTPAKVDQHIITQRDLLGHTGIIGNIPSEDADIPMTYLQWKALIAKESFGLIEMAELRKYDDILTPLFEKASIVKDGNHFLSKDFQQITLRSDIRKCFAEKTEIICEEKLEHRSARLLNAEVLEKPYFTSEKRIVYPEPKDVEQIIQDDKESQIPEDVRKAIEGLIEQGQTSAAESIKSIYRAKRDPVNTRTYQYIPYSFDSKLEKSYYSSILYSLLKDYKDIEIYFNGDESLTDFYIESYKKTDTHWKRIKNYYPDFLILKRDKDTNQITKVIIAETKGTPFEAAFIPQKEFMKKFIEINSASQYTKFEFLYIPESLDELETLKKTKQKIKNFLQA